MPKRIAMIDFPLGALLRRLTGNLMIVAVLPATAIGLTQLSAVVTQSGAAPEFSDPPGSGLIVRSEVVHLWLHGTLVDLARSELPALVAPTHQELKKALERRGQEDLWYAITVRAHLANHRAEATSFFRYPYRQPEYLQELMDVLAAVAGSPTRHTSADYSAAIVHVMPPAMSQREWVEVIKASSLQCQTAPHELERKR